MKRSKANAANAATKTATESLISDKQEIATLDDEMKKIDRLISDDAYGSEEVHQVAKNIFDFQGLVIEEIFSIASSESDMVKFLTNSNLVSGDLRYLMTVQNGNCWSILCVVRHEKANYLLYKNHFGIEISTETLETAKKTFSNVVYKNNTKNGKLLHANDSAAMCLKNMEIIVKGLKKDQKKFIKNFEEIQFCSGKEINKVKKQFKANIVANMSTELIESIGKDKEKESFTTEFNKLIEQCLAYKNATALAEGYHRIIQKESEKLDQNSEYNMDEDAIRSAQNSLLNQAEVKTMIDQPDQIFEPNELSIKKKFPKHFWTLESIFASQSKTLLKAFCFTFNISYEHLIQLHPECFENSENHEAKPEADKNVIDPDESLRLLNHEVFIETGQKSIDEVLQSMSFMQEIGKPLNVNEEVKALRKDFMQIEKHQKDWSKEKSLRDIRSWFYLRRGNLDEHDILEALALLDIINSMATGGHKLRITQIVSVLVFIRSRPNHGRLCQIQTGEGKTVIVSLIAAIKALQGQRVDIITSNDVLASESVESRAKFYELLQLSVSCNIADTSYTHGPRKCYHSDIVYGSIGNFQFDHLRDSFEGLETRSSRPFHSVILDEVDSMLIDNGGYMAKLAGPFPGMDCLKFVFIRIWEELQKAEKKISDIADEKLTEMSEELSKDASMPDDQKQTSYESYRTNLADDLMEKIKNAIKKSQPCDLVIVPKHLKQYIADNEDLWIDNAIYAKHNCRENKNYVIRQFKGEKVVVPVDYQNTGVTLKNTTWCNGLHQFVQLKHNLGLSSVTLTSCFISNVGYIKLYRSNIFGLTGTLGSAHEQKLLSSIYEVDYAHIPTYKTKIFKELDGIVIRDEQWQNAIAMESFLMTQKGRSVLIICETIKEAQDLDKNICAIHKLSGFNDFKTKTYLDENDSGVVQATVDEREVIIATNIAGRGTDLRTTVKLENHGGLHVIVSFMPVNQRVQDQAFGRTSRQGKPGTARLIIKESHVNDLDLEINADVNFDDIMARRDQIEGQRLERVKTVEIAKINFQDEMFGKFSSLYEGVRLGDRYLAKDLKEFWAFWLSKQYKNEDDMYTKKIDDEFKRFMEDAGTILGSADTVGQIFHNPFYLITKAEHALGNGNIQKAREALNSALALDDSNPLLLCSVNLKLFEVAMESGCQLMERFKKALKDVSFISKIVNSEKDEAYKDKASAALVESEKALQIEIQFYENMINHEDFGSILIPSEKNEFHEQLESKYRILKFFEQHIQSLQTQIKDSKEKGLALGSRIPNYLKELKPTSKAEKDFQQSLKEEVLTELSLIGIDTIYALREVYDVPMNIIHSARGQITAGLVLIATGVTVPACSLIVFPLGNTLIAEGVCDIVIELISKGNTTFDAWAYAKGKVISYGITAATMGLSAILNSTRMLNFAIKTCKRMAAFLRSCPYLTTCFEAMAAKLDKIVLFLENLKMLNKFQKLSKLEQMNKMLKLQNAVDHKKLKALGGIEYLMQLKRGTTRMKILTSTLTAAAKQTMQGVVMSVVMEKVVTKGLERSLEMFKPHIRKIVDEKMKKKINKEFISVIEQDRVMKVVRDIFVGTHGDMAIDVLKQVAWGIFKHYNSWKTKIVTLTVETTKALYGCVTFTDNFCQKLNAQMRLLSEEKEKLLPDDFNLMVIDKIVDQVTDHIYGILVQLCGTYANTLIVQPLMRKAVEACSDQGNNFTNEELEEISNFSEIVEAYETLNIPPGSSKEDVKAAFDKKANECFGSSDPTKKEDYAKLTRAMSLLEKNNSRSSFQYVLQDDMGHKGDLLKITKREKVHIVVEQVAENGEISKQEFGKEHEGNGSNTITLKYREPTEHSPGHYELSGKDGTQILSTGRNNCLFDPIAQALNDMGRETSTQKLRDMTSEWSLYDIAIGASELLNNDVTRNIYIKVQKGLLVGGSKPYVERVDIDDSSEFVDSYEIPMKNTTPITISQRNDDFATKRVKYTKGPTDEPNDQETKKSRNAFSKSKQPEYGGAKVDDLYRQDNQTENVHLKEIIDETGSYLQRGHLAPVADFTGEDKDRTFHHLNAVPMWNSINNGNWKNAESKVREKCKTSEYEITNGSLGPVMTGLCGTKIYLDDARQKLPVPLYLYKKCEEKGTGSGFAYITINHPTPTAEHVSALKEKFGSSFKPVPGMQRASAGLTFTVDLDSFEKGRQSFRTQKK